MEPNPPRVPTTSAPARGLNGTVRLNNGGGAVVRLPGQPVNTPAYVLSAGHLIGRHPGPNEVIQHERVNVRVVAFDRHGNERKLTATELVYATGDTTDLSLYRLRHTIAELEDLGITVGEIPLQPAQLGEPVELVSAHHREVLAGDVAAIVHHVQEYGWTWDHVLRLSEEVRVRGGHSGSPLFREGSNTIVGVTNTTNEDGEMGTLDNPAEFDERGVVKVVQHATYAVPTYPIATCTTPSGDFDLSLPACTLPQGTDENATPIGQLAALAPTPASTNSTGPVARAPAPAPVNQTRQRWLPEPSRELTEEERATAIELLSAEPFSMPEHDRHRAVEGSVPGNFVPLLRDAKRLVANLEAAGLSALGRLGDRRYPFLVQHILRSEDRLNLLLRDGAPCAVENVSWVFRNQGDGPGDVVDAATRALVFFERDNQSRSLLGRYANPRFREVTEFVRTTLTTEPVAYDVPGWAESNLALSEAFVRTLGDASTRFDSDRVQGLADALLARGETLSGNDLYLLLALTEDRSLRERLDRLLADRTVGEAELTLALEEKAAVTRGEGPLAAAREMLDFTLAKRTADPDNAYWQIMERDEREWLERVEAEFGERPAPESLSILTLLRSEVLRAGLEHESNRQVLADEIRSALANDGIEQGGIVDIENGVPVFRSVASVELEREKPFYINAETHPMLRNGILTYHVHALRRLFRADFAGTPGVPQQDAFRAFADLVERGVLHEDGTLAESAEDLDAALQLSDPAIRAAIREVILGRAYRADASKYAGPSGARLQGDRFTADWGAVDAYGGADVVITYLGTPEGTDGRGPAVNADLYYVDRRKPDEPLARVVDHGAWSLPSDPTGTDR